MFTLFALIAIGGLVPAVFGFRLLSVSTTPDQITASAVVLFGGLMLFVGGLIGICVDLAAIRLRRVLKRLDELYDRFAGPIHVVAQQPPLSRTMAAPPIAPRPPTYAPPPPRAGTNADRAMGQR